MLWEWNGLLKYRTLTLWWAATFDHSISFDTLQIFPEIKVEIFQDSPIYFMTLSIRCCRLPPLPLC